MSIMQNQYLDRDASVVFCEPVTASQTSTKQSAPYYSVEVVRKKAKALADKMKQRDDERPDGSKLTMADKKAWRGYIREKYPANDYRADIYYSGKDKNLKGICDTRILNINDYFSIYNLPRITAKNHEIRVNGELVAEYRHDYEYQKERDIFELAAQKDERFKDWKREQFFVSQKGKCAWCEEEIKFSGSHVDHVQPLVFFGANDPSNFVVSCPACNIRKSAVRVGWNNDKEHRDSSKPNAIPTWIGENKRWAECRAAIARAKDTIESCEA